MFPNVNQKELKSYNFSIIITDLSAGIYDKIAISIL
jgi:hypothetical protein